MHDSNHPVQSGAGTLAVTDNVLPGSISTDELTWDSLALHLAVTESGTSIAHSSAEVEDSFSFVASFGPHLGQ